MFVRCALCLVIFRLFSQVRALERQIVTLERAEKKVHKDIKTMAKEGARNQKAIRVSWAGGGGGGGGGGGIIVDGVGVGGSGVLCWWCRCW